MLIGVIADDFTGGSDIANTLAKGTAPDGGLHTAQFAGVPSVDADPTIEAGVVSLKTRSVPAAEAVAASLAALDWLRAQGCTQIVFKYCSTFDSTDAGNIGPVAEALAQALDAKGVVVCPAFPGAGRTVYQGHLFVHDRLLSESGMQDHPLTPMTDPDIRRVLSRQTTVPVALLPHAVLSKGSDAVRAAFADLADEATFVVADAISDDDLLTLGAALRDAALVTGGSGLALGLPRNFIRSGRATGGRAPFQASSGPGAILAGSCSGATRGQIDHHATRHPTMPLDVAAIMERRIGAEDLVEFIAAHSQGAPLVYSSGTPDEVNALQHRFGGEKISAGLDGLFADTARQLVARGYRKIVVAGGETSGAVAQAMTDALGVDAMHIGPEVDPGVPILTLGSGKERVLTALKSGNFGAPDFFAKALRLMGQGE